MIVKREYLLFKGSIDFQDEPSTYTTVYYPSTYATVYYLFGFIPFFVTFRSEHLNMTYKLSQVINQPILNREDFHPETFQRHIVHYLINVHDADVPTWIKDRVFAYDLVKNQGFTYTELGAKVVGGTVSSFVIEDHLLIDRIVTEYYRRQVQTKPVRKSR